MHLTVLLATGERRAFEVSGERATIGRRPDCDVHIDSMSVSRLHAEIIRLDDGSWELRDLDSLNGLEVDGHAVTAWRPSEGDEVIIGDARIYFGEPPQSDSTIILTRKPTAQRLTLDGDHRCLRYGDRQLGERLAPREYDLLKLLADAGGHVVGRRKIEEALWGADAYDDNALHQLVRRTREKIDDDSSAPRVLLTLPGVGYRIDLDATLPSD